MSQWDDIFNNYSVHESLASLKEKFNTFDHSQLPEEDAEKILRLLAVVQYTEQTLARVDPVLAIPGPLNQVDEQLRTISTLVDSFLSSKDQSQLVTANNHADNVLTHLTQLTVVRSKDDAEAVVKTMSAFRVSSQEMLKKFQQLADSQLSDLKKNADSQLEALKKNISTPQKSVATLTTQSEALQNNLGELGSVIEQQKGRLDTAIQTYQSQFSEGEERRRTEYTESLSKQKENWEQFLADQRGRANNFYNQTKQDAEVVLSSLNEQQQKAVDLLQIISTDTVTGHYKREALNEKQSADRFRWIALGFMAGLVAALASTLYVAFQADSAWQALALRIAITIALTVPAGYTAREAEKHRQLERRYKRQELELAAIDPYLAKFPEEKRHEMKEKLVERFFGQPEAEKDSEVLPLATGLLDLVKMAMQNLTKK